MLHLGNDWHVPYGSNMGCPLCPVANSIRPVRVFWTLLAAGRDDTGPIPAIFGAPYSWHGQHQMGDVWREPNLCGGQQPRGSADYWLQDPRSSKRSGDIPAPCEWWVGRRRDEQKRFLVSQLDVVGATTIKIILNSPQVEWSRRRRSNQNLGQKKVLL